MWEFVTCSAKCDTFDTLDCFVVCESVFKKCCTVLYSTYVLNVLYRRKTIKTSSCIMSTDLYYGS